MANVNFSVCWKDILERMAVRGIPPDSTELYAFSYFERMMQKIWFEIYEEKRKEEKEWMNG